MPGPRLTPPVRRKAVDGEQDRHDALCQCSIDLAGKGPMIGFMELRDAKGPFILIDCGIAGDDRTVRYAHDECRVIDAAIGIDQEARIDRMERGTAEPEREASGDVFGPDI